MALEDLLGRGIEFKLSEMDGTGFISFMKKRLDRFTAPRLTADLGPNADVVLSEVITALHLSQHWYQTNDDQDGTPLMYAVDVINHLQRLHKLPE